jgi:glycosyltransferase involved in cell wall biosynthesis
MESRIKISVMMSVYNGERYLKCALDSILSQTFTDFEFIIINDGSTDGSRKILESYKDERIRLFSNENKGQMKSLNEAIGYSIGEYIAILDADDLSLPERFEKQVTFMDSNPGVAMCGSLVDFIDKDGNFIETYKVPISSREIRREMFFHCPFIHSSVMIRKSVLDKIGYYNESFHRAHDYELWTRIVYRYPTYNLPEVLVWYRSHDHQFTKHNRSSMRLEGIFIRFLALYRSIVRK